MAPLPSALPGTLRYSAALDGIRAIAVISVLLVHLDLLAVNFLGVDLLFVLSGFLVTTLALGELRKTGRLWYGGFMARRAVRLLPAFYAFLAVGVLFSFVERANARHLFVEGALASLFYVNDIYRVYHLTVDPWIGHVWSLSLEQQFYALWPFALVWLSRTPEGRARLPQRLFTAALFVSVWRACLLAFGASPQRFYFCLDTRADELLIGCAAGAWHHLGYASSGKVLPRVVKLGPYAFALMVALSLSPVDYTELHLWFGVPRYLVAACLSATAIISLERGASWSKLFAYKPLVELGKVSYAFYLWHYPICAVLGSRIQARFGSAAALAVALPLTMLAAFVSQRMIEAPAQKWVRPWLAKRAPAAQPVQQRLRSA